MNKLSKSKSRGDIAIRAHNVSKVFKIYDNPIIGPIKDMALFWRKQQSYKDFRAVDGVSFEVRRGEVVGILGRNGSGKTTLLKMIAGLLSINDGEIEVRGKVTALLALGLGVHPEFSGRENIYYSGMLYGMSRKEVLEKMDSIIEFAELGDYIEQPMRTYSSGMQARLMFATAMAIDPDILIVDEALSAGDAFFVKKAANRIQQICDSGATILYVSHNLAQVQTLCDRVILLDSGNLICDDRTENAISKYNQMNFHREIDSVNIQKIDDLVMVHSEDGVYLDSVRYLDENDKKSSGFYFGDCMKISLTAISDEKIKSDVYVGFFKLDNEHYSGYFSSAILRKSKFTPDQDMAIIDGKTNLEVYIDKLLLTSGKYKIKIIILDGIKKYCEYWSNREFVVSRKDDFTDHFGCYIQPGVLR